ncbi:MAG: Wzz/FepE/Etk N-terminal domain-containing protein [Melioribacteraceae bacterium]|nr:Wzz/FepE/Etk N-terminal domain-containing protein [Melioribacteraceae bacterium]
MDYYAAQVNTVASIIGSIATVLLLLYQADVFTKFSAISSGKLMANEEKRSFLDFLKILTKWRRSLLLNFVLVAVISVIISLLLPKWYKASSLVMAPQTGASSMGGLSALMSNLPLGGLGLSAGSGNENGLHGILKSRTIADSVIDKYNLQEYL